MTDLNELIDACRAQQSSTILAPFVTEKLKESISSSIKVDIMVTKTMRSYIEATSTPFSRLYVGVTNGGNHAMLNACRSVMRCVHMTKPWVRQKNLVCLVVGSAYREMNLHKNLPHVEFHLHGKEGKDMKRLVEPLLDAVTSQLKKQGGEVVADLSDLDVLADMWNKITPECTSRPRAHTVLTKANTLIFEDVGYNFSEQDWCELFLKTGAISGYGYMLLPFQLIYDDMVPDPYFRMYEKGNKSDPLMAFVYANDGPSNGYVHKKRTWSLLMRTPVLNFGGISLEVELQERVGPMLYFSITRTTAPNSVVRLQSLPTALKYLRILDVSKMNWGTGALHGFNASIVPGVGVKPKPEDYYSVMATEFDQTVAYMLSLSPSSMNLMNTIVWARKRRMGLSMTNQEFQSKWSLPESKISDFALIVFIYVTLLAKKDRETILGVLQDNFNNAFVEFFYKFDFIKKFFQSHESKFLDSMVMTPEYEIYQSAWSSSNYRSEFSGIVTMDPMDEYKPGATGKSKCSMCEALTEAVTMTDSPVKQEILCIRPQTMQFTFSKTAAEIEEHRIELQEQILNEPAEPLRKVLQKALDNMPKTPFSKTIPVRFIMGPPGTGKSVLIRQIANPTRDLIVIPQSKLRADYTNAPVYSRVNGEVVVTKTNFQVKTVHHAYEARGIDDLFVDEETCLNFKDLCNLVFLSDCNQLTLVGDDKQCKIRELLEGIYIGDKIDLETTSLHVLLVNYRNPAWFVAMLNRTIYTPTGVSMRSSKFETNDLDLSINICKIGDTIPDTSGFFSMAFTKNNAERFTGNRNNTVRAAQGSTADCVILFMTKDDAALLAEPALACVALSRHRKKIIIAHDNSDSTKTFISRYYLDDLEFQKPENYVQYLGKSQLKKVAGIEMPVDLSMYVKKKVNVPSFGLTEEVPKVEAIVGEQSAIRKMADDIADCIEQSGIAKPSAEMILLNYGVNPVLGLSDMDSLTLGTYSQIVSPWFEEYIDAAGKLGLKHMLVASVSTGAVITGDAWSYLKLRRPTWTRVYAEADVYVDIPESTLISVDDDVDVPVLTLEELFVPLTLNTSKMLAYVKRKGYVKHDIYGQKRKSARNMAIDMFEPIDIDLSPVPQDTTLVLNERPFKTYDDAIQGTHNGQTKLLISEVDFHNWTLDNVEGADFLLYIGAAPGVHIRHIKQLFGLPIVAYDVRSMRSTLKFTVVQEPSEIVDFRTDYHVKQYFSEVDVAYFRQQNRKFYLISDIRRESQTDDLSVLRDNTIQVQWLRDVGPNCLAASIKWRPYYESDGSAIRDLDSGKLPFFKQYKMRTNVDFTKEILKKYRGSPLALKTALVARSDSGAYNPALRNSEGYNADYSYEFDAIKQYREYYADGVYKVPTSSLSSIRTQVYAKTMSAECRIFMVPKDISFSTYQVDAFESATVRWNHKRENIVYSVGRVSDFNAYYAYKLVKENLPVLAHEMLKTNFRVMTALEHMSVLDTPLWSVPTACGIYALKESGLDLKLEKIPLVALSILSRQLLQRSVVNKEILLAIAVSHNVIIRVITVFENKVLACEIGPGNAESEIHQVYYDGVGHYYAIPISFERFVTIHRSWERPGANLPSMFKDLIGNGNFTELKNDVTDLAKTFQASKSNCGTLVYAASGSGKTHWLNSNRVKDTYKSIQLYDADDLLRGVFKNADWWKDDRTYASTMITVESVLREFLASNPTAVVFSGYIIKSDYTVLISESKHLSNLSKRDPTRGQPVTMAQLGTAREYISGKLLNSFDSVISNILSEELKGDLKLRQSLGADAILHSSNATKTANKSMEVKITLDSYFPMLDENAVIIEDIEEAEPHLAYRAHPANDAYLLSRELMSTVAAQPGVALNEVQSYVVQSGFRDLEVDADQIIMPVNQMGNVKATEKTFRSVCASEGLNFSGISPMHAIKTARARYNRIERVDKKVDTTTETMARRMVTNYFLHCKTPTCTFDEFVEEHGSRIAEKFLLDAETKKYFERFEGEGCWEYNTVADVNFFMKQSFKPFVSTKDPSFDKAAQGISAWSAALLLKFCLIIRMLAEYDMLSDRKDAGAYVATDNGVPFPKFARDVAQRMRHICRYPVSKLIADAVQFDSNQDETTQLVERYYIKALMGSSSCGFGFADPTFLEHYYQFRIGALLRMADGSFKLHTKFEKLSGEPATLWLNGVVMKVLLFSAAIGKGEFLLIYKGDDGLLVQALIVVDEEFMYLWECNSILRVLLLFVDVGEFCGMVMLDGLLVPNAHRVLCKILAHRCPTHFKQDGTYEDGYTTFAEYQVSLRDTLLVWTAIGWDSVITATAVLKRCSIEEAEAVVDAVHSWAHVNHDQWLKETTEMTETMLQPHMVASKLVVD